VNDSVTLVAFGSTDEVTIDAILKERCQRIKSFKRPKNYLSENLKRNVLFNE